VLFSAKFVQELFLMIFPKMEISRGFPFWDDKIVLIVLLEYNINEVAECFI
jgi:hypothetical protein